MTNKNLKELQDLVLDSDTGGRRPSGLSLKIILGLAFSWSIFQIWIASPLPFFLAENIQFFKYLVIDSTKARYIHLAFALSLVYLSYPATNKSEKKKIPISDWALCSIALFSSLYLLIFYNDLSQRAGMATKGDVIISIIGLVLLLEATRRALGPPLTIIASLFLLYTYFGPYMPEVLIHKGHNLTKIASHHWLATEGVFGIALGVSTSFVFLFVLFGALLEKAGAGNYFIKVAFALLGHLKGGPAKAAVLSSGMTGLISGSSIANVVTTGTFTLPLMKKVGFSREKAGSVEVASSVNGQIMPPVMGAAAFLMVEYIGIPYTQVIKHAFIPAVISYIALLYIVHLEALKSNMKTLPKKNKSTIGQSLLRTGIIFSSLFIISGICYHLFNFLKNNFAFLGLAIIIAILSSVYIFLIKIKAGNKDLEDDPDKEITELPEVGPTVKSGLHFLLPIAVLIWCLMIERLSPGLSAYWATFMMILIMVTQRPLTNYFRKDSNYKASIKKGLYELYDGLISGAKNMAGIGVATAAAGIIVGAVTQTGVGNKMTEFVAIISGNSVMLMLLFTALICIILGMGLPTTANYIVVSSLMASVIVELGKQNGLIIPLVAVHFFVFYFGIMADVTPPVGLASFAAAAVSGGNPIKTSFQAFIYSMRTMILPFLFIFDNKLLLIGVESIHEMIIIFIKSTIAILVFTAGTQGYFIIKNKLYESIALIVISFSIFLPSIWMDRIAPPYSSYEATKIYDILDKNNKNIRMEVLGMDFLGDEKKFFLDVNFDSEGKASEKLQNYGLNLYEEEGKLYVSTVKFGSKAYNDGLEMDFEILNIRTKNQQPSNIWIYIPTLLLLILIYYRQKKQKNTLEAKNV
ncbi:MAG: TRAP transporter permease [Rickettsiales bacterium]|nr:TRAP transporter permease [Rickettsiales bacterium]